MFHSATIKLTAWYIAILMTISVLFSLGMYGLASSEVQQRLRGLQHTIQNDGDFILPPSREFAILREQQSSAAAVHLGVSLIYANLAILVFGGAGAYFLARRTLDPIPKAHEAQSRFVSDASHELRTPLAAMQMELEVALREKNLPADEVHEVLQSNLEEVQKLTNLSNMLLQLSRFEHAGIALERMSLTGALESVLTRYTAAADRISLTQPKQALLVHGNDTALEELLTILIDNAIKYSPERSPITAALKKSGHMAEFSITNQGEGIAADKLPHIFDRFYRANTSRSSQKTPGFGLGLSLAKQIVELHHGELLVTSGSGHPTTFTVRLPLMSSQSKSSAPRSKIKTST